MRQIVERTRNTPVIVAALHTAEQWGHPENWGWLLRDVLKNETISDVAVTAAAESASTHPNTEIRMRYLQAAVMHPSSSPETLEVAQRIIWSDVRTGLSSNSPSTITAATEFLIACAISRHVGHGALTELIDEFCPIVIPYARVAGSLVLTKQDVNGLCRRWQIGTSISPLQSWSSVTGYAFLSNRLLDLSEVERHTQILEQFQVPMTEPLLRNSTCPAVILRMLAEQTWLTSPPRLLIASHKNVEAETLSVLYRAGNPDIRAAVAAHRNCPVALRGFHSVV
jgi:hypothetical protein